MADACFSRDFCRDGIATCCIGCKEVELFSCRQVGYVQARTIFLCQFHGSASGFDAGLLTTDECVERHFGVIAPGLLHILHVLVDDGRVLAVGHQWQLAGLEDAL